MTVVDRCFSGLNHLDRADHLLNTMGVYGNGLPVREALVRHRALLTEARHHLETARALIAG